MYYEAKARFTKEFQDGTLKRVTEAYLVDAGSFTEAEARIYENVGEFVRGEFVVTALKKTEFTDLFHHDDSDVWYNCRVQYNTEDDNGKEKKVVNSFLVTAPSSKDAYMRIEDHLKSMMSVFEIPSIVKTAIVEVFPYEEEAEDENGKGKKVKTKAKKAAGDLVKAAKKVGATITIKSGDKQVTI